MRKILFVFIVAVLYCVFISYRNNDPKVVISNLTKINRGIHAGELKYRIYLLGVLPIGEAVFAAEKIDKYNGQSVYHLNATAKSLKIFSKIFSGYAILDSYVHRIRLSPVLFKQKLIILGKQDSEREVAYDQDNGTMSIAGIKRQIFVNTQDPLSAIFNIRRMDLDKIKKFEMNINSNQKNYILVGQSTSREIILQKRTYKIIVAKADIARRDNNFYHKSNITMVLVREKENIPILIKVFASGVLINARLIDIR